ncbi:hypothetical protein CCO03_16990 [Comamonas serinivorans]|uniref:Uncharacterized protein n=1 Tax=Comamonas serinivorans TaxID=1082851 RepID=A0A1Y0ESB9_9BURK|nr:hypothetical protein [Comamonas serinivorans]ARU06142.1 hypothetical protein CCO03_16990 [Comamonas serinivorans]
MSLIKSEVAAGRDNTKVPTCVGITSAPVRVEFAVNPAANDIVELETLEPGVLVADVRIISGLGGTVEATLGELNAAGTDVAVVYEAGLSLAAGVTRGAGTGVGLTTANAKQSRVIGLKLTTVTTPDTVGKPLIVELGLIRQ